VTYDEGRRRINSEIVCCYSVQIIVPDFKSAEDRNVKTLNDTSGSHGGEYKDDICLGYSAAWSRKSIATFQRCVFQTLLGPDDGFRRPLTNFGKRCVAYELFEIFKSH
jgi:hypothetical protein